MAERKSLSSATETSDAYLPNFRKMIKRGQGDSTSAPSVDLSREKGRTVANEDDVEIVKYLEKFRKILTEQGFDPLLLELAVVHEQPLDDFQQKASKSTNIDEQHFTSYMVSYLGRLHDQSLLLAAWNDAIDKLLMHKESGRYSLMAYEDTYQSSFLAEQFNWAVAEVRRAKIAGDNPSPKAWADIAKDVVEGRSLVFGKLKRVYETLDAFCWTPDVDGVVLPKWDVYLTHVNRDVAAYSPTVYDKTYRFSLVRPSELTEGARVESTLSYLIAGFVYSLADTQRAFSDQQSVYLNSILDFLMNCCLLVVPFRRPVAFTTNISSEHDQERLWGDSPGGCLITIIRPRLGSMTTDAQLDDLSRRFSLALSRAALREARISAVMEAQSALEMKRHTNDVLQRVTHHIPTTIKNVSCSLQDGFGCIEKSADPDLDEARHHLGLAIDDSEDLLTLSESILHAHKVLTGDASPKEFGCPMNVEVFVAEISKIVNERWEKLSKVDSKTIKSTRLHVSNHLELVMASNLLTDRSYLDYVIQQVLENALGHGKENEGPILELKRASSDSNEIRLIVSNRPKREPESNEVPKSRIGLTTLENMATAYSLMKPMLRFNPQTGRFVADVTVAQVNHK